MNYPLQAVPLLPPADYDLKNAKEDDKRLIQRKEELQWFLESLINDPVLSAEKLVEKFLDGSFSPQPVDE